MSAPDLAGAWALHGATLGGDGEVLYEWDADLSISQSRESIAVAIETSGFKSSRSVSFAEKLTALPSGEWHLRYGYEADGDHAGTKPGQFFGLSQLTFAPDLQSAEGSSCNYNGRYVVIRLSATRKAAA
nr:hypothetical protein [Novosphingobium sp. ERN07]